ncbi:MAG TPA: 30S ribosomal protein S3ae [Thermoplasmata archaeon]|nr:30S ribosomal protein S3ae [Thermoplasmata archaeon]
MAEKRSRTMARQARDRWRTKTWYNIMAPDMFDRASLGETMANVPEKPIGRKTIVSFQDLTGDYSDGHIKLKFVIHEVKGNDALTRFVGHDFRKDYVIRLARRRRSKIDGVFNVTTKDGYSIRVKPLAIAEKRIKTTQAKSIRRIIGESVREFASSMTFSEFVKAMLSGEIAETASKRCRTIFPVRRVEVKKSEVLAFPTLVERITDEVEEEGAGEEAVETEPTPEEVGSKEEVIALFTSLKGIGPMKAEALYEAGFDSLDALRNATTDQIAEVEGFSPSLAKKVLEQL